MKICGIHPFGHDSTVVLIDSRSQDVKALTLERVTRRKHDMNYVVPAFKRSILDFSPDIAALSQTEGRVQDIKMFRNLQNIYELKSKGRKGTLTMHERVRLLANRVVLHSHRKIRGAQRLDEFKRFIAQDIALAEIEAYDHHDCHAYSALWTSDFNGSDGALVVTIDGQGDDACATISVSGNGRLERKLTIPNDFSLCLLFSYFTEVAGFNPNADEGKLEALACYFDGKESTLLSSLSAWIRFDEESLMFTTNPSADIPFASISRERRQIIGWLRRRYEDMDPKEFAYVMQTLFEEKYLAWVKAAKARFGAEFLCLAGGGVANVKLNLRIFEEAGFKKIHIIPAMGDDGVALGAAIMCGVRNGADLRFISKMKMPYWGAQACEREVQEALQLATARGFRVEGPLSDEDLSNELARCLHDKMICSVYRGRAEYGPRALGHRSILANPTDPGARDAINNKFKRREWFQPFCPIILDQEAANILESYYDNKHMTCAFRVKKGVASLIPSVVHVDDTARAQIIEHQDEPFIYSVMKRLKELSGIGVLLNTSFNLHGRAMVNTPVDAINDFGDCGLDVLILESFVIRRP